jgi:beta-lactamase class A
MANQGDTAGQVPTLPCDDVAMSGSVETAIQRVLDAVGITGFLHARAIDHDDREVALGADAPVVMASVFKITVCLELYRQAAASEVDLAERHLVPATSRTPGPVGLSFMEHDAELSLADLAYLMMAVSDNAATDVIIAQVALDRINATLRSLGLERTVVAGDCADTGQAIMDAVGADSPDDLPPLADPEVRKRLLACRALDPGMATRTTPRELTALLAMIWRGEAGLPADRNGVAWLMAQQFCHARMAGAFPFPPWVGAKSGSLPPDVVNEAGVVDYLDGRRFAVAVFTRGRPVGQLPPPGQPRGAFGRAIGEVARLAVEHLAAMS